MEYPQTSRLEILFIKIDNLNTPKPRKRALKNYWLKHEEQLKNYTLSQIYKLV